MADFREETLGAHAWEDDFASGEAMQAKCDHLGALSDRRYDDEFAGAVELIADGTDAVQAGQTGGGQKIAIGRPARVNPSKGG